MDFSPLNKSWKDESFLHKFEWNGKPVRMILSLHWHSKLKVYSVHKEIHYGQYFTEIIEPKSFQSKKDARLYLEELKRTSEESDIEDLSQFYKNSIMENTE